MSRGQHAADDGSFPRSAGGAMARGIGLILVAVLLGVVLLRATDSPEPFTPVASDGDKTQTTEPADSGEEPAGDDTTTTTAAAVAHNPSEVGVLVANGTGGVKGAARTVSDVLKPANYQVKPPTDTKTPVEASIVYYVEGYEADAKAVAALLTPQPSVQPMPDQRPVEDLAGAQLLVVVAADLVSG